MPRVCTICMRTDREGIDTALVGGNATLRDIARQHGVTKDALSRHRSHITEALAKATEAGEVAKADDLLARIRELEAQAKGIQAKAEKAGDLKTALAAVREQTRIIELLARLAGELESRTHVDVSVTVEHDPAELRHLAELARQELAEMRDVVTVEGHTLPSVTDAEGAA